MDFKLKIACFLFVVLSSCSTNKLSHFEYHFGEKEKWINSFKTEAFLSCFQESYKNDSIMRLLGEKDFINQYEIIADWTIIDKANELGKKISSNIPKPIYPKFEEGDEEKFYNKNYFLASCLNYYKSKELDSIAKCEFKKHLRGKPQ